MAMGGFRHDMSQAPGMFLFFCFPFFILLMIYLLTGRLHVRKPSTRWQQRKRRAQTMVSSFGPWVLFFCFFFFWLFIRFEDDDTKVPQASEPFGPFSFIYFHLFVFYFYLQLLQLMTYNLQHYYINNLNEFMCSLFKLSELVIISCLLMPLTWLFLSLIWLKSLLTRT